MADRTLEDIADLWLDLWRGDLSLLDEIVAEDVVTHAVPPGGETLERLHGRDPIRDWVADTHRCFEETTDYEVGPLIVDSHIVVRWHSTGSYRGGLPDVPEDAIGRAIDFRGIDILRVEDGLVSEFWISADTPVLMAQLMSSPEAA